MEVAAGGLAGREAASGDWEKEMIATLTSEQIRAIAEQPDQPTRLADPETNQLYVLLREDVFERLKAFLDDSPQAAYEAIDRTFAEGWNDPQMDDYDRYEELRQ